MLQVSRVRSSIEGCFVKQYELVPRVFSMSRLHREPEEEMIMAKLLAVCVLLAALALALRLVSVKGRAWT